LTSRSRAEPFVPKFDRDRQGTWLRPARLDQESVVLADDVGRVLRVAHKTKPVARLIGEAQAVLDQRIIADPASTGNAVIVATADKRVRALAARDLSPVGSWVLDAPLAGPPIGIEDMCFVMDRAGGVMAFGRDGQRIWSIQLESAVVGAPLVRDQSVWLITQRGLLHVRALSNGQARGELALSLLPSGGLVLAGKQLLVPVGQGTLRTLTANPGAEKRP
jgi:PQQ-like domain